MTAIDAPTSTGADLLRQFLRDAALAEAGAALPVIPAPWERLARHNGWAVWLGHPPVPDDLELLPAAPELLWDDPFVALATATTVSLDYAERRGADSLASVADRLAREAPVAVVVPGDVQAALGSLIGEAEQLGIPIVRGSVDIRKRLAEIPSFAARSAAHGSLVSRSHDPSLSFQTVDAVDRIGGNPLSSFVLHHEGEQDGVSVIGERSARWGVEVGVQGHGVGLAETAALEAVVATYPSFLDGVTSRIEGHSLELAWSDDSEFTPQDVGEVIRIWLKALNGVDLVDVRIAFAPPQGRSALLTDMRARAAAFKEFRASSTT